MFDDEKKLEYECPECGASFPEGAVKCPDCGIEFDWDEEPEFVCPECGEKVKPDARECPSCKAQFVPDGWEDVRGEDEDEDELPASDYEMLEAAVAETIVFPKLDEEEEVEAEESAPAMEPEAPPEEEAPEEEEETEGLPGAIVAPKRYPGGFTWIGIVFIVLSGVALIMTIVALRWDTLARGEEYESIGSQQLNFVLMGLAGFIVCAVISVYDLIRSPREIE